MNLQNFLKLVEIQTKLASMLPLILGTLYSIYRYGKFDIRNFLLLFFSLLIFDMTTTAINNYYDYKKAIKKHGYGYESHNAIVKYNLKENTVILVILFMLILATALGVLLYLATDIIVLLVGMLSFAVGILYSFGPLPISRTPFGEMFSGFFMGFIIIFLSIYIHIQDLGHLVFGISSGVMSLSLDIRWAFDIFIFSVPSIAGIANIMLANNICDMDEDLANKRFTLPNYIGKTNALKLFKSLYIIGFCAIILATLIKTVPIITLLAVITGVPVLKNIAAFYKLQTKKDTFALAVKNFMLISAAQILFLGIACTFKYIM